MFLGKNTQARQKDLQSDTDVCYIILTMNKTKKKLGEMLIEAGLIDEVQ